MYYIRIDSEDTNKLIYYCRNCGKEDNFLNVYNNCTGSEASNVNELESLLNEESKTNLEKCVCVSRIQIKKDKKNYNNMINKYTKLDPTLPRTNKIQCPNTNCKTNTEGKEKEIIYERYDDINIKYIYLCSTCETVWKTDEDKI
jgi:hypothetical protein